jgi:hypothetical protein
MMDWCIRACFAARLRFRPCRITRGFPPLAFPTVRTPGARAVLFLRTRAFRWRLGCRFRRARMGKRQPCRAFLWCFRAGH